MGLQKSTKSNEELSRILLIDDDVAICDLISKYLQHHGHVVDVLNSPDNLEVALRQPYDAVLLDVNLQGIDGFSILDQITRDHPGLAVVMLTAVTGVDSVVSAMRQGAFDYLPKPSTCSGSRSPYVTQPTAPV